MNINAATSSLRSLNTPTPPASQTAEAGNDPKLRETFDTFIGETFYGQMLEAMRKTQEKPAYFHGGRAEEIFQGQLDQTMAQEMTKAGVQQFSDPMYKLFTLSRQ